MYWALMRGVAATERLAHQPLRARCTERLQKSIDLAREAVGCMGMLACLARRHIASPPPPMSLCVLPVVIMVGIAVAAFKGDTKLLDVGCFCNMELCEQRTCVLFVDVAIHVVITCTDILIDAHVPRLIRQFLLIEFRFPSIRHNTGYHDTLQTSIAPVPWQGGHYPDTK